MTDPVAIRLGGADFAVRALTLRQLRSVLPAFARAGAIGAEDGVDAAILVSYTYTQTTSGNSATITNQLLGAAPTFQANFYETFQGKQVNLQLNQCIAEKLTLATKLEDFTIPAFDFMAFADAAGNLGKISLAE